MTDTAMPSLSKHQENSCLSRQVSLGSAWMFLNTVLAKSLSLIAQVSMGWFLSERDFGVYAIAISISTVASLLRDGGLSRLLVNRGSEYERLQGPVFWMMLTFNSAAALVVLAIAPAAAQFYAEPQLEYLLFLVGVSLPLLAPGAVLRAKLSVDLRFGQLGAIQACSSLLRYVAMVSLACFGHGAASFLLPVLAIALFEWLAFWLLAKSSPWRHPAHFATWPGLFNQSKWILVGTFAIGFMNYGAYFVIGKLVPKEIVGVYFFAFQIVLQIGVLLSNNLYQVLFPAFSRIVKDTERCRVALLAAMNVVTVASTWLSLIIVPVFSPIEVLVWHGKWAVCNVSVQILSICYPPSVVLSIVMAIQSARGDFRQWALMTLSLALGNVIAAAIGAYWGSTAEAISLCFGGFTLLGTFCYAWVALHPYRIGGWALIKCLCPAWLIGLGSAAAAVPLQNMKFLVDWPEFWVPWVENVASQAVLHSLAQIVLASMTFSLVYIAGIRVAKPLYLQHILELFPTQYRIYMGRLLWLSMLNPTPGRG